MVPLLLLVWLTRLPRATTPATRYVDSGSMAPHFYGPSFRITCADCRLEFRVDALTTPGDFSCICPNCGCPQVPSKPAETGQPVSILSDRNLRRWMTVACKGLGGSQQWSVKRIAGLPDESVSIRDGDVYINGNVARKSLAEIESLAILVHDDSFRAARGNLSCRWHAASSKTQWAEVESGYHWQATNAEIDAQSATVADRDEDWLVYHHTESRLPLYPRDSPFPLSDDDAYNQTQSRTLHLVTDYFVSFQLVAVGDLSVTMDWVHVPLPAKWIWQTTRPAIQLRWQDREETITVANHLPSDHRIVFGFCDRQLFLGIDGREVFRMPYDESAETSRASTRSPSTQPVRIGVHGYGTVDISQLAIYRDVYYTHPRGLSQPWELSRRLGDDEFFLLGDNSPNSRDGRFGHRWGIVRRDQIMGQVVEQSP